MGSTVTTLNMAAKHVGVVSLLYAQPVNTFNCEGYLLSLSNISRHDNHSGHIVSKTG